VTDARICPVCQFNSNIQKVRISRVLGFLISGCVALPIFVAWVETRHLKQIFQMTNGGAICLVIGMLAAVMLIPFLIRLAHFLFTWTLEKCLRCEMKRLANRRLLIWLAMDAAVAFVGAPLCAVLIWISQFNQPLGSEPPILTQFPSAGAIPPHASPSIAPTSSNGQIQRPSEDAISAPSGASSAVQPPAVQRTMQSNPGTPNPSHVDFSSESSNDGDITADQRAHLNKYLQPLLELAKAPSEQEANRRLARVSDIGQLDPRIIGSAVPAIIGVLRSEPNDMCKAADITMCLHAGDFFPGAWKAPFADLLKSIFLNDANQQVRETAKMALRYIEQK
jgi:hypothetical protein